MKGLGREAGGFTTKQIAEIRRNGTRIQTLRRRESPAKGERLRTQTGFWVCPQNSIWWDSVGEIPGLDQPSLTPFALQWSRTGTCSHPSPTGRSSGST